MNAYSNSRDISSVVTGCVYVCVTKICEGLFESSRAARDFQFAVNERYLSPPELLYLKLTIFTIGAKRKGFLFENHAYNEK